MVKDHSDSEKGNPLPPHRLLLSINSKDYFICTIPQTDAVIKCSADGTFQQDRERSGRPRKTKPREDRSLRLAKELRHEYPCYFTLKRYINTFQLCFETTRLIIATEVPRADTKATPYSTDVENSKETLHFASRHRHWTLAEWKKVLFSDESTMHQFVPHHMHITRSFG